MKIQPLYPMILVTPDPVEEKTSSGIVIPDFDKKPANTGTIKALGEEIALETGLTVGDRIMWKEFTGIEVDDEVLVDGTQEAQSLQCKLLDSPTKG